MQSPTLPLLLKHVPRIAIAGPGDCRQALGVDFPVDLPVVVINLDHRPDRMAAASGRLASVGIDKLIRAPAVNGAALAPDVVGRVLGSQAFAMDRAPDSHLTLTLPALGCFLSHLAVWRWAIEHDLSRVLVLEDDAVPEIDFDAVKLRAAIRHIDGGSDLVFLGCRIMDGLADRPDDGGVARVYYFNGTFAYLITRAACHSLAAHLTPPRWHIDHQISKVLFEHRREFRAVQTVPNLFYADWSLVSDCYVPLTDARPADRELGDLLRSRRRVLLDEGRPLLPPFEPSQPSHPPLIHT